MPYDYSMNHPTRRCGCTVPVDLSCSRLYRNRWCVGHEREWQRKLKRLVFVPIILLPVVIFVVIFTRYVSSNSNSITINNSNISIRKFDQNELLENEDRRDVLEGTKTSYIPDLDGNAIHKNHFRSRPKRDRSSRSDSSVHNYTDSEEMVQNNTDLYEYLTRSNNNNVLDWKMSRANNINNRNSLEETVIKSDENDRKQLLFENKSEEEQGLFGKSELDLHQVRSLQAKTMKKYMNQSCDPCDDFYQYACGNWDKYHTIPADRASYDTFEMLRENLDVVLRDLLSETDKTEENVYQNSSFLDHTSNNVSYLDASLKAKLFYKSCMNEERLYHRGEDPLITLLNDLGGWPIISPNWTKSNFDVETLMAKLKLYNNDILVTEWIGPDIMNSKYYIIQIDQTTLGLPGRAYFLEPGYHKYVEAYKEFLVSVATILGAHLSTATQDADDIIAFETEIATIMTPSESRRNISDFYVRTDIGGLQNYVREFDWVQYFKIILGKDVSMNEEIACYCMDYLYKLMEVLEDTPPRTIANYLLWRFVRHRTNNLDERFLAAKQNFYFVLFGREQAPPRWQFCVSQVNSNMGMALGSLFVRKYFDENSKNDTLEMTKRLQEAFKIILRENKWLGDQTKDYAKTKIDKMNLKIGYPDFLLDGKVLSERYYDVVIHPEYFFENTLSILRHLTKLERTKLGTEVNKTVWGTAPAVVNAYYSRNKNQIIFPAGILQPPFYHKYFPRSLNFGGIGVVIGHEITHGFDDKGRLFDQHGNLQQWWKEDSIYNFHQRARCMIDQYNSYIIPDVDTNMDGFITQGENIADNGGLKQAFRAYEMWLENHPEADETLPGLNLTGKQLFFLNFAQVWCGKQRLDTLKSRLKVAVHAPGIFRVIGTLSNSEDFARVYNCPVDSFMNPAEKCSLW